MLTLRAGWLTVARAWLAFIARPRPDIAPPVGASPAAVLAALLAVATPLALAAAVAVAPLAERFGVESKLDFRFSPCEAALVLAIAPALEELVFRWPLKSRRTFERGIVLLPPAGLALFAIARAAAVSSDAWIRLPAIAVAATASALALLALDDALQRHRFTAVDGARTPFTRHYAAIAHGLTFAFALTHGLNYEFTPAAIALLPRWFFRNGSSATPACTRASRLACRRRSRCTWRTTRSRTGWLRWGFSAASRGTARRYRPRRAFSARSCAEAA